MKNVDIKEMLLNEYFQLKIRNHEDAEKFIGRLEIYIAKEPDAGLSLVLLILKTIKSNNDQRSFLARCDVAAPIFEQLEHTQEWRYLQLHVLSQVIANHTDFEKVHWFFQKAIDTINEKYAEEVKFKGIHTSLRYNLTVRILRARYIDPDVSLKKLRPLFRRCYDHVMEVCVRKNLPLQHTLQVLRGVFENKLELITEGLLKLKELGDTRLYKNTKHEIVEYLYYMEDIGTNQELLDFLTGYQIRERRMELGVDAFTLAMSMDMEEDELKAIERGEATASIGLLMKISRRLGVSLNYFKRPRKQT